MLSKRKNQHNVADYKTARGFRDIYERYSKKMFDIGYSKTNDVEITRGIVQDIFMSLWARRLDLKIDGSIEDYLMSALKFKIIDHYRSCEAKKRHNAAVAMTKSELDSSTEEEIAYNELQNRLITHIDKLPPLSKKIFKLSKDKGLSNREIAKSLSTSERTVYSHLSKALSYLKKELESDYRTIS